MLLTTTKNYFRKEDKTLLAKITDGNQLWHRMGDVGYLDENNLLWFCGRKDHRVTLNEKEILFTIFFLTSFIIPAYFLRQSLLP